MPKAPQNRRDQLNGRADVISRITSPLALFALIALVIEAILASFAVRATGHDLTVLVYGMIGCFVLLIIVVAGLLVKGGTSILDSVRPAGSDRFVDPVREQSPTSPNESRDYKSSDILIPQELRNTFIRCSFSGLIRIEAKDRYLLVRGNRLAHQFQPVGGVYKRYTPSMQELRRLGVLNDDKMPIDDESKDDLRVRVKGERLNEFIRWFDSRRGRETSPWREFHEELIATGMLNASLFPHIAYSWDGTHRTEIRRSEHLQCEELLIAEIFELHPTPNQLKDLLRTQKTEHEAYRWVSANEIEALGLSPSVGVANISPTAKWMLSGGSRLQS